jgi:hypothetical protein
MSFSKLHFGFAGFSPDGIWAFAIPRLPSGEHNAITKRSCGESDLTLPASRALRWKRRKLDSTERGRSMWARVKGKTENALLQMPFKAVFLFRSAYIQPLHVEARRKSSPDSDGARLNRRRLGRRF